MIVQVYHSHMIGMHGVLHIHANVHIKIVWLCYLCWSCFKRLYSTEFLVYAVIVYNHKYCVCIYCTYKLTVTTLMKYKIQLYGIEKLS